MRNLPSLPSPRNVNPFPSLPQTSLKMTQKKKSLTKSAGSSKATQVRSKLLNNKMCPKQLNKQKKSSKTCETFWDTWKAKESLTPVNYKTKMKWRTFFKTLWNLTYLSSQGLARHHSKHQIRKKEKRILPQLWIKVGRQLRRIFPLQRRQCNLITSTPG